MKEDWAENLKQKLEGNRKTPPAGLWEGIIKEMGMTTEPVSKLVVFRRWSWIAAAAILAIVGFFVFHELSDRRSSQVELTSLEPNTSLVEEKHSLNHVVQQTSSPLIAVAQIKKVNHVTKLVEKDLIKQESEPIPTETETQKDEDDTQDVHFEDEQSTLRDYQHSEKKIFQRQPDDWKTKQSYPSSSKKWSIGVLASGGILASENSQRTILHYNNTSWPIEEAFSYSGLNEGYTMTDFVSEHHLPLRFGVGLNYQLSPRLNLQSGIKYTYLYSKFQIPLYPNDNYDQKLHYLGIPLGLSWQLWTNNRFSFYVAGDVMLEKCLNEKPWQCSVDGAVGVEYTVTPQFGFYLEPSLGYYFNDGSSLEHYYKEHPWSPSIELGLRLHIHK